MAKFLNGLERVLRTLRETLEEKLLGLTDNELLADYAAATGTFTKEGVDVAVLLHRAAKLLYLEGMPAQAYGVAVHAEEAAKTIKEKVAELGDILEEVKNRGLLTEGLAFYRRIDSLRIALSAFPEVYSLQASALHCVVNSCEKVEAPLPSGIAQNLEVLMEKLNAVKADYAEAAGFGVRMEPDNVRWLIEGYLELGHALAAYGRSVHEPEFRRIRYFDLARIMYSKVTEYVSFAKSHAMPLEGVMVGQNGKTALSSAKKGILEACRYVASLAEKVGEQGLAELYTQMERSFQMAWSGAARVTVVR